MVSGEVTHAHRKPLEAWVRAGPVDRTDPGGCNWYQPRVGAPGVEDGGADARRRRSQPPSAIATLSVRNRRSVCSIERRAAATRAALALLLVAVPRIACRAE